MKHGASTLLFLVLASCNTTDALLLESTTTEIPAEGAMAASADGRFRIVFEADSVTPGTEVTIETLRNYDADGLISHVYRVGPRDLTFARDANVEYDLFDGEVNMPLRFIRVDEDRTDVLAGSQIDKGASMMRARVRRLDRVLFAVWRREPPACSANSCGQICEICDPADNNCVQASGYCAADATCQSMVDTACVVDPGDSWNVAPGRGPAFIINRLAIAGRDMGIDLDGKCDDTTCVDNFLWRLGELTNDQIRQGLLGGESLLLIELAGLDEPYDGDDSSLTIKTYSALDADDPFFPANNFKIPPGHTTCCEFKIHPTSLSGIPPQARWRAPGLIERGRFRTLAPTPLQLTQTVGVPPHPELRLERTLMVGELASDLSEISVGLLGAALPVNALANIRNPYCRAVSPRCPVQFGESSMLDLVSTLLGPSPDIDLDGDGLECVVDTTGDGAIDLCCDGVGTGDACGGPLPTICAGSVVPAIDSSVPSSCAKRPEMADGYSVAFEFAAVRASIVGIAD